mgnify:FL=1
MEKDLTTDSDKIMIDFISNSLKEVGKDDDVARLRTLIENSQSQDKLKLSCEFTIAWIRQAQDLRNELEIQRQAGYL